MGRERECVCVCCAVLCCAVRASLCGDGLCSMMKEEENWCLEAFQGGVAEHLPLSLFAQGCLQCFTAVGYQFHESQIGFNSYLPEIFVIHFTIATS